MDTAVLTVMILQTGVFAFTLLILARQVRQQADALRANVYNQCRSDYSSLVRMMVGNPSLHSLYDDLSEQRKWRWKWPRYSDREKTLYNYFELIYELFERVFYLRQQNWINEQTWQNWETWLSEVMQHPLLEDVARDNMGMFGKDFEKFVLGKITSTRPSPSRGEENALPLG